VASRISRRVANGALKIVVHALVGVALAYVDGPNAGGGEQEVGLLES
jgi:hypothetical protein